MKVLVKNVFGSAAARFVNLFITLATVPLTINALSPSDYAYFAMAISLSVLATYADLGMGLAIVNVVAQRGARPNSAKAQRAISVVWFTLLGIAAAGLSLVSLIALWVNFGITSASTLQFNAMLLAAGCVFAGLPTGLVQRVLFAEQRNIQANAWSSGARVIAFCAVWMLVSLNQAKLLPLVFAVIGLPMLIGWLSVFVVFTAKASQTLRHHWRLHSYQLVKPYIFLGFSYLILQSVAYVETGVDTLIVGGFIDLNLIASYDVHLKLFSYIPALISIAIFPMWPAIANAKASGNMSWILKLRKIGYFSIISISTFVSMFLLNFSSDIVRIWLGNELVINSSVLLGLSVYCILSSIGLFQSMFLNGMGEISGQVKLYSAYIAILILAKIIAATMFGLVGVIWVLNFLYISRLFLAERLFVIKLVFYEHSEIKIK